MNSWWPRSSDFVHSPFATRAMLQRTPERLEGKRVVVYQFAERELAFGDWKMIGLPESRPR